MPSGLETIPSMEFRHIFSKRKRLATKAPVRHGQLPAFFRKQVAMILSEAVKNTPVSDIFWVELANRMKREVGSFWNSYAAYHGNQRGCTTFIQEHNEVDECLDFIELSAQILLKLAALHPTSRLASSVPEAITEINGRFREHYIGYRLENGQIVQIDDEFMHSELVGPVLGLLGQPGFEVAAQELMTALHHHRGGNEKDAIVAANRAFESTLKAVCKLRGWAYEKGARASDLIKVVRNNGLFSEDLDEGLSAYVAMMKTGLPGLRNKAGGHGSDPHAPAVAEYMAGYAIHMSAANILLICKAHQNLK